MTAHSSLKRAFPAWFRVVGVALLIALIVRAGPRNLAAALAELEAPWLILGLLLNIPQLGLKALRWQLLVCGQGARLSYRRSFVIYLSALLLGFLTPGRVGEAARAFALRRETGLALTRGLLTVILDRFFDLCLLVTLAGAAAERYGLLGPQLSRAAFAVGAIVALLPLLLLNARVARGAGRAILRLAPRSQRERSTVRLEELASGLAALSLPRLVVAAALTVSASALLFLQVYCCAWALDFTLAPADLVLVTAVTNLVGLLPVSVGNLGTREACLVTFFVGILQPPRAAALALSWGFSQFVVLYLGAGLLGFVCWQVGPVEMRGALRLAQDR